MRRRLSDRALEGFAFLVVLWAGCSGPRATGIRDTDRRAGAWRLVPIHAGLCSLGEDHVLGGDRTAERRIPFALLAFYAEGPRGERVLVDLGPMTLATTNAMFRRYGFFRDLGEGVPTSERFPDDIVQPHGNVFAALERLGVRPRDVGHIVFTHLHADHHGIDDAKDGGAAERFPRAVVHISRRGWEENLARRKDGRWGSYVDFAFSDFLLRLEGEGRLHLSGDEEILPGLETIHLGGHSECSQAVLVRTADGPAILTSDEVYLYRLLEEDILPRISTTPERYRAAVARLVERAETEGAVLVPSHDPEVWRAYEAAGERWLSALRPLSEKAVRGYRSRARRG